MYAYFGIYRQKSAFYLYQSGYVCTCVLLFMCVPPCVYFFISLYIGMLVFRLLYFSVCLCLYLSVSVYTYLLDCLSRISPSPSLSLLNSLHVRLSFSVSVVSLTV